MKENRINVIGEEDNVRFSDIKSYEESLGSVYTFFTACFNTILENLKKLGGKIELTEEEQEEFRFAFLCYSGTYTIKEIKVISDNDWVLVGDCDGEICDFDFEDIHNDIIILDMVLGLTAEKAGMIIKIEKPLDF